MNTTAEVQQVPFPKIDYPTTREIIAQELKVRAKTVRRMMRALGIKDKVSLSPIDIRRFREAYIDGKV